MAASTVRPLQQADTSDPAPGDSEDVPRRGSRLSLAAAVVLAALCAIALLLPVIAAPVNADDRYWYLIIGWRAEGSALEVLRWSSEHVAVEVQSGRLAPLAGFERRLVGMAVIEAAVATSTPIVAYQALVKLVLVVGGLFSGVAFVRSLRWRDVDGGLVRAGQRTLLLAGVGGILALAVGAQAHSQFRNGWTSYPVFTYGAVIFIFGSVALLLWLTRLVAERSKAATAVTAVVVLLLLAVATNLSYELVYPAVPVAAAALAIVPVTDRAHRSAGRRAKLLTGSAYLGGFTVIFIVIRLFLADACTRTECYEGVQLQLGPDTVRTVLYNLVTAIPGAGGTELLADLDAVGWADRYPALPGTWSVTVGLGAVAAMLMVWWATRLDESVVRRADSVSHDSRRAEAVLLTLGAGLSLLVAFGTAAVMGLSGQAQELITEPGTPYRNTMVTWTALAFALTLVVRAVSIIVPRRGELPTWAAFAVLVGFIGVLTLPGNLLALQAHRVEPGLATSEAINWEVVLGDTSPDADARRCALFERLDQTLPAAFTRSAIYSNANAAFRHYHGRAFCSDSDYPSEVG